MELSMWSSYFIDLSPEEMVREFAGSGWRCTELSTEHGRVLLDRGDAEKEGAAFRRMAGAFGFTFPQGHFHLQADIAHPDPAELTRTLDDLKRWCDLFAALGVRAGVLHPGGKERAARGQDKRAILDANAASLDVLLRHIGGGPTEICLENLSSASSLFEVLDASDVRLRVCLDTGHLNMEKGSFADFTSAAGERLKALHVTDSIGDHDDHILPHGAGTVDWPGFVRLLREIGYTGLFNYEVPRENRCPLEVRRAKLDYALRLGRILLAG